MQRNVASVNGKNYFVPEGQGVTDVIKHLDANRPTFTLLYFTAKWNPACAKIERDYENLTTDYPGYHHIRVDCDATPKLKRYFDTKYEPSFLVIVAGAEIERIDHYNFGKIG